MRKNLGRFTKRLLAGILTAAMMFTAVPVLEAEAASSSTAGVVEAEDLGDGEVVTGAVKNASEPIYAVAKAGGGVWVHATNDQNESSRLFVLGYHQALKVVQATANHDSVEVEINYRGYTRGYIVEDADLIFLTTASAQQEGWVEGTAATQYQILVKSSVTHGLNIHSVPGVGYASLGYLTAGATAPVVAYSDEWVEIKYKNNQTGRYIPGYVARSYVDLVSYSYVTPNTPNVPQNVQPETPTDKVTNIHNHNAMAVTPSGVALNVHVSPSISSRVFTTLKNGYMVTAVSRTTNWVAVEFYYGGEKVTGYVYRSYVKLVRNNGAVKLTKRNFSRKKGSSVYEYLSGVRRGYVTRVKWKSSNKKVATISKNGKIKAKRRGTTTITCKYWSGGKWKTLKTKFTVK